MRRAFTLLEVMVAVAILGVALTAIFASEIGAVKAGQRARMTSYATLLARCKMGEVEEDVMRHGLPAISAEGTDRCCEGGEIDGYECDWKIERIVLPDVALEDEEGGDAAGGGAAGAGRTPGEGEAAAGTDAIPSVDDVLTGGTSGTGDALGAMALDLSYPIMKPTIEEQVRRATVTVRWHEGTAGSPERSFSVVQFLVAEQPNADDEEPSTP